MPDDHEKVISLLNKVKYLYLNSISEPRDNSVRIVVDEATDRLSVSYDIKIATDESSEGPSTAFGAIKSTGECRRFELSWKWYIAYLVTEEAAGCMGRRREDEISEGSLFSIVKKSHFLDHISRDTGGHSRPVLHFRITCLNHLIDVASYEPPEMRLLGTIAEIKYSKTST